MQLHKIENFKTSNPGQSFPSYRHLNSEECAVCIDRLRGLLQLDTSTTPMELLLALADRGYSIETVNAQDAQFDLRSLLDSLGVSPRDPAFINWYRFDDIDEIAFCDLVSHFSDIWYPRADDIDIWDVTVDWVLSLSPEGHFCWVPRVSRDSSPLN